MGQGRHTLRSISDPVYPQKTRINDLSCSTRMWAQVTFVLLQSTRLTDRWTDRQRERPWQYHALHYMQSHGKN